MNLKDRLENIKQTNNISIKDNDNHVSYFGITNVFADSIDVRNLILNLIQENKNIIFAGDKSIDKIMAAAYFQSLIGENNSEIINSIDENITNKNFQKNIVPNPDIYNIVKIFEYIIYGYKSFIFGLDLDSSDNFIDKIKTLIALNFKNLTDTNINTLIGSSNSVFVFISKNEDGLYFISEINKINYVEGKLFFENIFSYIFDKNTEEVSAKQEDETFEIEIESDEEETDNSFEQELEKSEIIKEENTNIETALQTEEESNTEIISEDEEDVDIEPNINTKNEAEVPTEIDTTEVVKLEESLKEESTTEVIQPEVVQIEKAETNEKKIEEQRIKEEQTEEAFMEEIQNEKLPSKDVQIEKVETDEQKIEESKIKEEQTEEASTEEIQIEEVPTEEAHIEESQIEESPTKKINKYKLLKEKIKNKKNIL